MIVRGSKVIFGRPNGEQTTGEVVKVNPTTYKIRTLEERGSGRGAGVGAIWKVHKSLVRPANAESVGGPTTPTGRQTSASTASLTIVARALGKLTGPEREALAQHFRQGYIKASMF